MCATIDSSRDRRILLLTVFVFLWFASSPRFLAADPPAMQRPNVLVIITDDQGYGDLSCHGNPVLKTQTARWQRDDLQCRALSNLAELCRSEPELVRAKVGRLVVMGGEFPDSDRPETNIRTHREAAQVVAAQWPGEIVWHGFEIGQVLIIGEQCKWTPRGNPVRRAYELRQHRVRPSIEGGQPSYDQMAALFAVRGAEPEFWETVGGGRVIVE